MPWTPPVGGAALTLAGDYSPPVGGAALPIGGEESSETRTLTVAALTQTVAALAFIVPVVAVTVAGQTAPPTAAITFVNLAPVHLTVAGQTASVTAALAFDVLSPVYFSVTGQTQTLALGRFLVDVPLGNVVTTSVIAPFTQCALRSLAQAASFAHGATVSPGLPVTWQPSALHDRIGWGGWSTASPLDACGFSTWQDSMPQPALSGSGWQTAPRLQASAAPTWNEAAALSTAAPGSWIGAPFLCDHWGVAWHEAATLSLGLEGRWADGLNLSPFERTTWQDAGYPRNVRPVPPVPPPDPPLPWANQPLSLRCSSWSGRLHIGDAPCGLAKIYYPIQRSYFVLNSASLTLLPDRTPLPCTSMTVATDSGSWCWTLSANLSTPEAWTMVEPLASGFPREVEATINGRVWQFALDNAQLSRAFARTGVSLTGRSRSAWLDDPYQSSITVTHTETRSAQQIAEAALELTGWGLVWQLTDWTVPARTYSRQGTIIGRVGTIVKTVGGALYSDPVLPLLTAYPQYPQPAWLWAALTPALSIPEAALISLQRQPQQTPSYNGLYLAGTQAGRLVFAKIAGTDGLLRPQEPLVDSLFCDDIGAAARQRAIAELSQSGFSYEATLETLYPPELGLIRPGQYLEAGGLRGMVRGVAIRAGWSGQLTVRQTLTLEQREV